LDELRTKSALAKIMIGRKKLIFYIDKLQRGRFPPENDEVQIEKSGKLLELFRGCCRLHFCPSNNQVHFHISCS
jgi:hypothetical protein